MNLRDYEEVFDVEILNTDIPKDLKAFMEQWGISTKDEVPVITTGVKKLGLKKIYMGPSEIYLYFDQISSQAANAGACNVGFAYDLLKNQTKIPAELNKYILVFETTFVDKKGLKSFLCLTYLFSEKKWKFNFAVEGFMTPSKRSRFLCLVE